MISSLPPSSLTSTALGDLAGSPLTPAQALKLDRAQTRLIVEVSSQPEKLPDLTPGETLEATITGRLPDGKLAATIKGEPFVLAMPKGMALPATDSLPLRVAGNNPLALLLDGKDAAPAAPTPPAAESLRSAELARTIAAALADENSTPLQTLSQPERMPALQRGEVLTARLAERLPDGSAVLLVKNGAFNLKAPTDTVFTKEPMLLRVTSTTPTAEFSLLQVKAPPDQKSAPVALTSGGRSLNFLLDAAATQPVVASKVTLLEDPAAPNAGEQLRQTVEKSGVFYESHQKAWVDGRLSLEELKQEPQATLAHAAGSKAAAPEIGQLVQKQLDVHEQRAFVFEGQAWPGQAVQWQIQREQVDEREARSEDHEMPVWQTRLSLDLPALGDVGARLRMVGKQLQVVFDAGDAQSVALIEQHQARLSSALEAAGLSLASLLVKGGTDEA